MAPFRSGFVVLAGRPNAGKSTLLNALLKFKLSIVSPKPQTTRHKILGILNLPDCQVCLLDTPGLLTSPNDGLRKAILKAARGALRSDADAVVLVADPVPPDEEFPREIAALAGANVPVVVAINRVDTSPPQLEAAEAAWQEVLKPRAILRISALRGDGVAALLETIKELLPEGEPYYDREELSDRHERFFVAEIIREVIFQLYSEEVPHSCAVVIDSFTEKTGRPDQISASVFVERDSQKGILIGSDGRMIRDLRARSAAATQKFLGRPAEIEIQVKVRKGWRKDPQALKDFGYLF